MKKFFLFLVAASVITGCSDSGKKEGVESEKMNRAQVLPADPELLELNRKISESPANPHFYDARAKYYIKKSNFPLALQDMKAAFTIDSGNADFYLTLADYHIALREPGKARLTLEKALEKNPRHVASFVKLGELYFYARKHEKSFEYLNKALRLDKYHARAYFLKGMNYKEMKDTAKAISGFQTAIEQDPDYYDAYMQLGLIQMAKKDKSAVEYLSSALRLQPQSTEALYARALYYQESEDYNKAIEDYTTLLKIDSSYTYAHYNLGYIHYHLKVIDVAYRNFDNAVKFAPRYAEAYYMRGLCLEAKGEEEPALGDYRKALELKPGYRLAMMGMERLGSSKRLNKVKK